ncbi:MAG: hypothetical protein QNJ40_03965 [Xanthomonadales bacterium]|nr:hypothetical protein [Xanthomonadales bacterium]
MTRWIFALLVFLLLAEAGAQEPRTVFINVNVLTMAQPDIRLNQAVIVRGNRIDQVLPTARFQRRAGDHIIDGDGQFLLPGLVDSHIHIDHPQDLKMLALYGVTSAVNMRGLPWHLRLRDRIRSEGIFSPDFLTGGDYLDGDPPNMLPMSSVKGPDSARRAVGQMHAAGYDFIKVYSELSREQYLAVCQRSRELGTTVVGHVPDAVSLDDLTRCPHLNVAHGEQLFKVLESREDRQEIKRMLGTLTDAGITFTANMAGHAEGARMPFDLDQLVNRPEAALIHPATFQPYRPGINRYARRGEDWAERVQKSADDVAVISALAVTVNPAMLVAGSDMPVAGCYPGASLLSELDAFRRAGLTANQALAAATVHAGRLMRQLNPAYPVVGVVQTGARADLVLVRNNPLDDLDQLGDPAGVMLRGLWYDADRLGAIRNDLRRSNQQLDPKVRALETAVFSRDMDEAARLFRQYRSEDPDVVLFAQYPFFFFGFSLLYGEGGLTRDPEQARKALLLYDMVRQTYPEVHSSHHVYGLALEATGDGAAARKAQLKALEIFPEFPPAREALERLAGD